nr:2TM domain-containing protein [Bacillus sp. ISL-4]
MYVAFRDSPRFPASCYWWFLYPLGGWGIGVLIHELLLLHKGTSGLSGKNEIKEYMEKDKKNG